MDKKEVDYWKKAQLEVQAIKHKNKLEQIKKESDSKIKVADIQHDHAMEQQRIKSAEIRKNQQRKSDERFANSYTKNY